MKKLKSNSGASLSLALLLFVVCAVVGSVILAAVTAGTGRTSKLTEMDQRYYSVTSAVELLRDTLDGQQVTIVREEKTVTTRTSTYTLQGDGSVAVSDGVENSNKDYSLNMTLDQEGSSSVSYVKNADQNNNFRGQSFLSDIVLDMLFGVGYVEDKLSAENDLWTNNINEEVDYLSSSKSFTIAHSASASGDGASAIDADALKVKVSVKTLKDSNLTLVVENDNGTDPYKIQMTFSAVIRSDTEASSKKGEPVDVNSASGYTRTETEEKTERRTDSVAWKLVEIKKVDSSAS